MFHKEIRLDDIAVGRVRASSDKYCTHEIVCSKCHNATTICGTPPTVCYHCKTKWHVVGLPA